MLQLILTKDDDDEMKRLKGAVATEFEIKDLGFLRYFLGMEVMRNKIGISISQRKCTLDLLKETGMMGCIQVDTPMDPNLKLGEPDDSNPIYKGRY